MVELYFNLDSLLNRGLSNSLIKPSTHSSQPSQAFLQALRQQSPPARPVAHAVLPPLHLTRRLEGFVSIAAASRSGLQARPLPYPIAATPAASLPTPAANTAPGSSYSPARTSYPPPGGKWPGQISFGTGLTAQGNKDMFEFQFALPVDHAAQPLRPVTPAAAQAPDQPAGFAEMLRHLIRPEVAPADASRQSAAVLPSLRLAGQLEGQVRIRTVTLELLAAPLQPDALAGDAAAGTLELMLDPSLPRLLTRVPYVQPESADARIDPRIDPLTGARGMADAEALPAPQADAEAAAALQASAFPAFFPLFPLPAGLSQAKGPDFAPAFAGLSALPELASQVVFSFSYVELQPVEVGFPQPRMVLVPLAVEPRPLESWLLTLLEAAGFLAELESWLQGDGEPAAPVLDADGMPLPTDGETPVVSAEPAPDAAPEAPAGTAAKPAKPAAPAAPRADAAHPAHPVHPDHPVHPEHPVHPVHPAAQAAQAPEQPLVAQPAPVAQPAEASPADEPSRDPELGLLADLGQAPVLSLQDLATLPPDVIQGLDLALLLSLPADDTSVWPEDEQFWQDMLMTQPLSVRPPLAAGASGQTAVTVDEPSGLTLPLGALLPVLPAPDAEAGDALAAEALPVADFVVAAAAPDTASQDAPESDAGEGDAAESDAQDPAAQPAPVVSAPFVPMMPVAPVTGSSEPVAASAAGTEPVMAAAPAPQAAGPAPLEPAAPAVAPAAAPVAAAPVAAAPPAAPGPVKASHSQAPVHAAPHALAHAAPQSAVHAAPQPAAPQAAEPRPAALSQPAAVPEVDAAPQVATVPGPAPAPQVAAVPESAAPAAPAASAPQPALRLLALPQGTLQVLPLSQPAAPDEAAPVSAARPQADAPRLSLVGLRLGQLQLRPVDRQVSRGPLYGELTPEAQLIQSELVTAPATEGEQQPAQDGDARRQDAPPAFFAPAPPEQVPAAVPFRFDTLAAPARRPAALPAGPESKALSPASGQAPQSDFGNWVSHEARQLMRLVDSFVVTLAEPVQAAEPAQRPAAKPAPKEAPRDASRADGVGTAATTSAVSAAPLTASQVIQASNNNVPVHIANFPAFVNRVIQTMDPGSRVVQSIEVTLTPDQYGQVTAQFGLTSQNKVLITLYTQSAITAQTLESYQQEIQQIVGKTSLNFGQMVVKQAVAPARQGQGQQQGGSFGSGQQGTGGADYGSRQFRRNRGNRGRRGGEDNLSIDVGV